MLALVKMTPSEYEIFTTLSMEDYAKAKSRGEGMTLAEGKKIAQVSWSTLLPEGQETPSHHFWTIKHENQNVGAVWIKEERNWENPFAYLYQIWVWQEFQGQGLGKRTMNALESEVKKLGLARLKLHVFAYNERALKLYQSCGYEVTNLVMVKELK